MSCEGLWQGIETGLTRCGQVNLGMDVSSEQSERRWVGIAGGGPIHSETLCASVGCDRKYGGVCTIFFVGEAGCIKGLEEGSDIPYVHLACFGPSGDQVGV